MAVKAEVPGQGEAEVGAGQPIFTLDALSDAEALSTLKELAVAMFAVGICPMF